MRGGFTTPCGTPCHHTTAQVKGGTEDWAVGLREVTRGAVFGKSLATTSGWSMARRRSGSPLRKLTALRCTAVFRRLRVERKANGEASPVMANAAAAMVAMAEKSASIRSVLGSHDPVEADRGIRRREARERANRVGRARSAGSTPPAGLRDVHSWRRLAAGSGLGGGSLSSPPPHERWTHARGCTSIANRDHPRPDP